MDVTAWSENPQAGLDQLAREAQQIDAVLAEIMGDYADLNERVGAMQELCDPAIELLEILSNQLEVREADQKILTKGRDERLSIEAMQLSMVRMNMLPMIIMLRSLSLEVGNLNLLSVVSLAAAQHRQLHIDQISKFRIWLN
jgi:hypothetical protein